MPRTRRAAPGGFVYRVLNRAVARLPLFHKDRDYEAFERVMAEALREHPTRLLAYCIMPNHWHLVVWPERDGELTGFVRWLTHTHTMRWHTHYHTGGTGHLYQGRFKGKKRERKRCQDPFSLDRSVPFAYFRRMGRPLRAALGGYVYHVLNRGNGRATIFHKAGDFEAFERILAETLEHVPGMRLTAYCLMPNHWHLLLWPRADGELSDFLHWLTLTHTQRWHVHYHNVGGGHLYQGRFKSFPIQADEHYLTVCRYVERNGVRAALAARAEAWRWSSLWRRGQVPPAPPLALHPGPVALPANWAEYVNKPETEAELEAVRRCVERGQP